jgi:hypothetical protein
MHIAARDKYRIKIVCRQSSPTDSWLSDVLTTDIVTTRTAVVDIAARLQKIFPKPDHAVLVHLLEHPDESLQIDWETPERSGQGPA